jgi:hypothetical protein
MDLRTVAAALDELLEHRPHLPRPVGLEQVVLTAWTSATPTSPDTPHGHTEAVIRATWPLGARAGADRGHRIAVAAIRDLVAHGLTDDGGPNPDGRWVLWACAQVADTLPARPDTTEVAGRVLGFHQWVGDADDLDVALALGLGNGWLAGHRDATDRLVEHFAAEVTGLVGAETLTTTFLNAYITGDDVVFAICTAAYLAAEHDQTAPPAAARTPNRAPVGARAFTPLRHINPATRHRPNTAPPPPSGPFRTGTSR